MHALGCDVARSGDTSSGEIGARRDSSDCLSEVDLESGGLVVVKLHSKEKNRAVTDCRICHLGLESCASDGDGEEYYGLPIQLGCSCKGDLGTAHRKCADTWFKMKGNMTCEICGATALNVAGEQANSASMATQLAAATSAPAIHIETQSFWHGRRVMNFLLVGMVFAFIISWLFHFKFLK